MRVLLLYIFLLLVPFIVNAQKAKTHTLTTDEAKLVKKDAASMFDAENYDGALAAYLDLYKSDPKNYDYNFRLGYCYLNTNVNKRAALQYIDYAMQWKDAKKEWLYFLGEANMYNEQWDEAVEAFEQLIESKVKIDKEATTPERMIEMCNNGEKYSSSPVNCSFTNMGKIINTPFEEYNPFISADNTILAFTSRRKGNMGGFIEDLGFYTADVYTSTWKDTAWGKARSVGANINTEWDEETVGFSPAGDQMLLYFDNSEFYADIGSAPLKGKMWQRPTLYPEPVNSKQVEGGAAVTIDGNTIIFSSDRKEGSGKSDLWMVEKKDGEWGSAVNLKVLNSPYDEMNPVLSLDGRTLYFASTGWTSMGGYDIFYSRKDASGNWSAPVNLGFPLNDADDNMFISFTGDLRFAYLSAVRKEGLGGRDIYRVEFLDTMHHKFTHVISGTITAGSGRVEITKVTLESKSGVKTQYRPNSTNNTFAIPADPGEYVLRVEGYNFAPYTEDITVGNEFPPEGIKKNIQLTTSK